MGPVGSQSSKRSPTQLTRGQRHINPDRMHPLILIFSLLIAPLLSSSTSPLLHGVDVTFACCKSLVGSLDETQKNLLQHHIQSVLHLERRLNNLRQLHENNVALQRGESMKEGMKHAFKTDRTIQEMHTSIMSLQDLSKTRRGVSEALVTQLKADKKLPANATLDAVMPCLSSRLDTQLFPGKSIQLPTIIRMPALALA